MWPLDHFLLYPSWRVFWEAKLYLPTDAEWMMSKDHEKWVPHLPWWPSDYPVVALQFLRSFCSTIFPFSIIINCKFLSGFSQNIDSIILFFPIYLLWIEIVISCYALHLSSISHLLSKRGWWHDLLYYPLTQVRILGDGVLVSDQLLPECTALNVPKTLHPKSGAGQHFPPKCQSVPGDGGGDQNQCGWKCCVHCRVLSSDLQRDWPFCLRCQEA